MMMKFIALVLLAAALTIVSLGQDNETGNLKPLALSTLERSARVKMDAKPRVPLAEVGDIKNADALQSGNVPNYIRAMAGSTKSAQQYANLVQTFVFGGTVGPEIKMAMGLRIAQMYGSPYLYAQTTRWLRSSARGRELLSNWDSRSSFSSTEVRALVYAEKLTNDIHGVADSDFADTRGSFNDSQLVELTMTVCFFNHFVRVIEALNLPVESWVLDDKQPQMPVIAPFSVPMARISLVSDKELDAGSLALTSLKQAQSQPPPQGLGIGVANSQRAMMRVPDLQAAWRDFGNQNRVTWSIERNIQLQISFAVSMANGCRYCTLHQVLGLRRLGVDPKKLLAMKKDDSALTPRELAAVEFARKLTIQPASVTDEVFSRLKKEFGEAGAVEVILQTGAFAFMNRFTDGLRLPSEDEAVQTYKEVYGEGSLKQYKF
jgi:AhpD family alkylhydroperoxidase